MQPHPETVVIISLFSLIYLYDTFRETARQNLDFYDLIMLSTVGVLPIVFALVPSLAEVISKAVGVTFPFVVMFGALIAILFIFIHRLTRKIHRLESACRHLVQDLGILREQVRNATPSRDPNQDARGRFEE